MHVDLLQIFLCVQLPCSADWSACCTSYQIFPCMHEILSSSPMLCRLFDTNMSNQFKMGCYNNLLAISSAVVICLLSSQSACNNIMVKSKFNMAINFTSFLYILCVLYSKLFNDFMFLVQCIFCDLFYDSFWPKSDMFALFKICLPSC